ncbi:arylesterase [Mucilaginibacter terrae]|uniref:Acyl-CoA thioesterase-1 n=1 Tax=Mucilaginibacter terrae TaxID=1955052 RepID=A0ABU3H1S5_9SPHI|nr:arylesterase [Mucilaginibacter terrae]MDT3405217.1 acyl-CoA thioesterase-1 [Mucilaginibacter terrae]
MIKYRFITFLMALGLLSFTACESNTRQENTDTRGAADTAAQEPDNKPNKVVLFFGDSLTAGHGLDDPATDSYPSVIQQKINDAKLHYTVVNAGNSGETSAGGRARIDWVLKQKVDIFVLELGANDGLRGTPVSETTRNLQFIIDKVKAKYPEAKLVIAGMQMPPSMGADYTNGFKNIFPKLAQKNNMILIPFLLDGVGGVAKLNQDDGIHPTPEGAKIVADNVWKVLEGVL